MAVRVGLLVVALALAGCGGGGEWPGPPQPRSGGTIPVAGFNDHLDAHPDAADSPEALAIEFLRLDDHDVTTTSLVTSEPGEGGGTATVVARLDGLFDDSVASVRYVLVLREGDDGWRLASATRAQRCRHGRGHAGFSAEPCV